MDTLYTMFPKNEKEWQFFIIEKIIYIQHNEIQNLILYQLNRPLSLHVCI